LREPARLRRTYFDCRYGQLHVHQAIPPGGGFDEATALVCIPGDAGDGRFYTPLLGPLGADRSIYAPDLPGCGQSDGGSQAGVPAAERAAHAIADLLDSLRQRKVDAIAHASGAQVLLALVAQRPGLVRRAVLSAAPQPLVAQLVRAQLPLREMPLAGPEAEAITPGAAGEHLPALLEWFGAASAG
jgi:pimeloyl-ACP methyl ester carboxylesterase